ncbi:MAG: hypothetical protein ACI8S6_005996 [Myxococcota bacterium]|jgi:hypothetical protein
MAGRSPSSLARAARLRVSRGLLRLLSPRIDASAADGGLGPHPLGEGRPPWWSTLPRDDRTLLDAALCAESDPVAATARLSDWLASDTPGDGAHWSALDEVACRLIHLAAIHSWVNLDDDIARTLAGSARAHGAWLSSELAREPGDPDIVLAHAALIIAGLSWPSLPEASRFRAPGISGLRTSLSLAAGEDGAGRCEPARLARAAWATALARAWLDASNAALPREADAALLRTADAIWRIGGDTGVLPPPTSPVSPLLPLGPSPLPHTLCDLMVAWGLREDAGASTDDPACTLLAGKSPAEASEPMSGTDWRMWAWRVSGVAVSHRLIRKQPARAWLSVPARRLSISLSGEEILSTTLPDSTLRVARVDGSQATMLLDHGDHVRDLRLRQARLTVTDEGLSEVRWQLPPWPREATDKGFEAKMPGGGMLIIKTDPAWRWVAQDDILVGTGEPQRVRYSFELR